MLNLSNPWSLPAPPTPEPFTTQTPTPYNTQTTVTPTNTIPSTPTTPRRTWRPTHRPVFWITHHAREPPHQTVNPDHPRKWSFRVRMSLSFRCRLSLPSITPPKCEVEIETVSSDSDHPCDALLRHSDEATGSPRTATSRRSATLLPPADVQAPHAATRTAYVRQANRQLFNSLHAVYGRSDPLNPSREDNDDDDGRGRRRLAHPYHGQIPQPGQIAVSTPGMGWILNDPLSADFYKIVIPDPTITTTSLTIAPYVTYSVQPHLSRGIRHLWQGIPHAHPQTHPRPPSTTRAPPATPDHISLLTEHPYAEAITAVVKRHFPTAHVAALTSFNTSRRRSIGNKPRSSASRAASPRPGNRKWMRQRRPCAYSPHWRPLTSSGDCSARARRPRALSTAQPNAADHFLPPCPLVRWHHPPTPRSTPCQILGAPPTVPTASPMSHPPSSATSKPAANASKATTGTVRHPADHEQQDDLREQANLHHSAHVAITRRRPRHVEQKRATKPRKRCWGCRRFGHSRPDCPNASRREPPAARREPPALLPAPTYPFRPPPSCSSQRPPTSFSHATRPRHVGNADPSLHIRFLFPTLRICIV